MASKMTRAEKERRQAVKENEKAKKKKEKSKSSSSSKLGKLIGSMIGKPEKKTFAEAFEENTKKLDLGREKPTVSKKEKVGKTFSVDDEKRYNPLTKTAVRTPEKDITVGNEGRTREELERRKSTRDLAQMTSDDWLKKSRDSVALKDSEKAGVGLGTIQHGTLNKNAELFMQNWNRVPQGNKVDAAIQIIYTYGVNDQNRALVMSAFNGASTFDKRKMMDAVVQTDGWNNVAYEMRNAVNNAPDSQQALMQQITEDMNVRNGNYLDTFQRAANKGIIDQNTLQQKEDKVIADWAKENYNLAEALKYRTLQTGAGFVNNPTDKVAFGISDLLQAGQQDNVLDGINPFEGIGETKGLGNKVAKFGTNVLHDLFRLAGINVSVFSKTFLTQDDVDDIAEKLMSITEPYQEAVRNNMVAMENGNLSEAEKELVEVYGMVIEQIPNIVMSLVASPAAGLATTGMTAGGKYARSAFEQGATLEQAVQFGLAGAAAEVGSEKLFTGFGYFGKGLSSKLLTNTTRKLIDGSTFKNSVAADMLRRVVAGGGEATEEMIVEIITPYLERSTYDPSADGATMEEILHSGGMGFIVAQILGLPANALGVTGKVLESRDTKAQEDMLRGMVADAVKAGRLSEEDAANINEQINDIRSGKGTLTDSEAQEEVKTTGENLDAVYANFDEAREAMQAEAKGKQNGESVSARFMQDGEAKLWTAKVMNGSIVQVQQGITTGKEKAQYAAKAQKVASATNTAERTGYQLNVREDIVKEVSALSKAFGKEVEFYYDENSAVHGNVDLNTGKIYVNVNSSQSPAAAVIAHEMTHLLENTSSYKTLTNMMQKYYASSLDDKRNDIIAIYKSDPEAMKTILDKDGKIKMDVVDSEVMAAFIEEKLLTDYDAIRELTRADRTLAQKIVDWINKVIQKISGSKEQRFLMEARDVWNKALQEEKSNKKAPVDGADKRYSIAEDFTTRIDRWDNNGRPLNERILVGTVSDALKSIGIGENSDSPTKIYWHTNKLRSLLKDHPEIKIDTVKTIPNVLENPVIILENPNKVNRFVMFGDVYGTNDIPVMVVAELSRKNKNDLLIEQLFIVNSYTRENKKDKGVETTPENRGKDTTQTIIDNYRILYTDPDEKRTNDWMAANRLQLPLGFVQYGPIGRITYFEKDVKGGVSYGDKGAEKTSFQSQLEELKDQMENRRHSIGRPTDTKAERRDAEEAMKVYDDLLEEEIENAPELTANEKREIDRNMVMSKEEAQAELDRLVKQRKAKREKLSRTLSENLKLAGKLDNSDKRRTANNRYKLNDEKIRKERIRIAQEWHSSNKRKAAPGSAESMYLKNRSARQLMDEFRRGVMTYLVEHGEFIPTESGGVVLDEHGAEVAKRDTMTGEWDVSFARNDYTPSAGLIHLAELEGFDADVFYTIYSHIRYLKTAVNKERKGQYHREDIVQYIVSLSLTQKQKDFLYLDVAGYASSTRPIFLPGGRVKEKKGNQRGRLIKSLDNIAIDMFAGATKEPDLYDGNHRISNEDVLNFANEVYGEEDSQAKEEFLLFFTGRLITYTNKMMEVRAIERTNLLTDKPKEADPYKAKILRIYRNLKKELIAEGEAFERMSDKLNNPLIRARYYDAKKSLGIANEMINGRHQRNINGEAVGKGLHKIFEPVFKADEKANNSTMITELTLLVNCRHDIYRMKYETEYTGYTKEECEAHIERISKAYPNLVEVADELVEYGRNLLQMCVDCGRISEGDYNYFIDKYPYYVPTFRLLGNQYYDRAGNVVKRGNDVLHKVKGGTQPDVLPLYDQLVRRTNEIVKACKKNQLATELAKAYRDPKSAEFISDVQETMRDEDRDETIDRLGIVEDVGLKQRQENGTDNIIPWYCAGVQHDIIISDTNMLYGWDRINYRMSEGETLKVLRKLNSMRRAVLTQYNPTFWLTNHFKDVGDMFLYNQHAQRLPKYYALAWKTMVSGKAKDGKNRDYLEEYLAHGMAQTSIFEYDLSNAGRRTRKMKAKAVAMIVPKGFNELNFIVEQVPRLAVYMETVDRLETQRANGDNTYTNEEIKTIAGYQASDATLNFGRSGTAIKNLNTYGVTFLNAGVQGLDRARRMVTQIKDGNKQAIVINVFGLVFKSVLFGLGFGWIQDWLFGGDDEFAKDFRKLLYGDHADKVRQEYLEMADYQRLNYFIFKWPTEDGNGIWLRILPKSRLQTMMYSHVYNGTKLAKDEIDGWDMVFTQWDMLNETIFPASPLNENILGPILDIKENKDAWGDEIISEYENKGEGFSYLEYDEDTTDLSMAIAELAHRLTADDDTGMSRLDISPKKMDYLLEQYFGSWADFVMPLFDYKDINIKENSLNALNSLVKKFYIDPTFSNRLAGDYYELSDLYQNVSEAYEEDTPYAVASDIFVTVNTQLKPLREASKEIKRSKSMTKGEALAYLDDIISQAEMYDTDLFDIKEYRETIYRSSDKELSRKERTELARVITDQMNQIYRTATSDAKALQEYASANYHGKEGNGDLYKEWYQNNKSAEWQITKITANSDSAKEDWEAYSEAGGDAQSFVDFYNFYSRTNSTYDKNGDQVKGQQKKDKCVKRIRSLDISADLKEQLYLSVGGWSEKKMPRFKDGSELTMDIDMELSHPLGEAGEVSLSFMVDNNGHTQIKVAPGTAVGAAMVGSVDKIVRSEKYGDSIFIKSTDKNGNTIVIQYYGLEEVGGNHEGGAKKYDYIEAGDMIGKAGKDGLKFKITVNGKPVDAADYLDLGKAGTINEEGYTTTKIGEEEREDDDSGSSGGGSGGGRGGRGSSGGGSSSFSTSGRNATAFDSVKKIGEGSSPGRGVMLPTASQVAEITGRSTKAPTYAQKGVYLPKASDYNTYTPSFGGSVATTPQTARTGRIGTTYVTPETPETQRTWRSRDSRWDENILS